LLIDLCYLANELINHVRQSYAGFMKDPFINSIASKVELNQGAVAGDLNELLERVKKAPEDLQARYDLGVYYNTKANYEKSIEQLMVIIKSNPSWNERIAINTLLKIFEVLGPTHDITISGRKKLAMYLH